MGVSGAKDNVRRQPAGQGLDQPGLADPGLALDVEPLADAVIDSARCLDHSIERLNWEFERCQEGPSHLEMMVKKLSETFSIEGSRFRVRRAFQMGRLRLTLDSGCNLDRFLRDGSLDGIQPTTVRFKLSFRF